MKDYIVLDLENPNVRGNSICSIAIIIVENNEITDKKYTLINPEDRFDSINSRITGIDARMVLNSPTLKEFWNEIKDYFSNYIVTGHNVIYDLSVLSKSLDRYDIELPTFNYCCTLELSQKYLKFDSYKLEDIARNLDIKYNPHNALEDANASYQLFEYINSKIDDLKVSIKQYNYEVITNKDIDSKLASNINDLYGIVRGINYDGIINNYEIELLKRWIETNLKHKQYTLFNKIINQLQVILEDNYISEYEKIELTGMIQNINSSKIYNEATLGMQVLQGIMRGISCDEKIVLQEIEKLKTWLEKNNYLSGIYPYDKVLLTVNNVLEDGTLTVEESQVLATVFNEILNPVSLNDVDDIILKDKTFCLTGEFKNGSKLEIKEKIESMGAVEKSGVSSKLDYLFVGGIGSEAWKYGNIGGKIAKAQELQENGCKIKIISEEDLIKMFEALIKV